MYPQITGIASGLAYLHSRNVIHGDLKAANILLDDALNPKICDFGMAKVLHTEYELTSAALKGGGSWRWMSPELIEEESKKTTESDIYAFGMTIAEVRMMFLSGMKITSDTSRSIGPLKTSALFSPSSHWAYPPGYTSWRTTGSRSNASSRTTIRRPVGVSRLLLGT